MRDRALRVVAAAAVLVALACRGVPDGPQPIAWDREPCAHCRMVIGEPRYAAQVITADGDVHAFDDPGCALRWLAAASAPPHAIYFRHADEPRWIPGAEVGFRRGDVTPMGSALGAVDRGAPGAIPLDAALAEVRP